jgi:hypothetical protein
VYILLASVTCDLFHPTITITLLVHMALIKEHCEEAYEEALKYLSHCVILSILLSVYSILYNGVLVLSMVTVAEPQQIGGDSVAKW